MSAEPVLIVALSGRALAASARAAGFAPVVLDAFADRDTRDVASVRRIPVDGNWRFDPAALLAAAAVLAPPPVPLVWGSGFEREPQLLAQLACGRELLGTAPEAVAAAKDPLTFAGAVRELGLPHPEIRLEPPAEAAGWLVKQAGAAGGSHVRPATAAQGTAPGRYWQRWVEGVAVSALVAGDGVRAMTLGLSEQWQRSRRFNFRYEGAVVPGRLPPSAERPLAEAAAELGQRFAVRGLASVDALFGPHGLTILELNPRPGAAFEAYEMAHEVNLFERHVAAARGSLGAALPPTRQAVAAAIAFATCVAEVPAGFAWPFWTGDRGDDGTRLGEGAPICTVRAAAADAAAAKALCRRRIGWIRAATRSVTRAGARSASVGPATRGWPRSNAPSRTGR